VYCDSVLYVVFLMFYVQSSIELLCAINHFTLTNQPRKLFFQKTAVLATLSTRQLKVKRI